MSLDHLTKQSHATPDRSILAAGVTIAVLALIAFWPVASGSRSFLHMDLWYEHIPIWQVTQKALLSGESPFWIEGEYCGHPLLLQQEAPIFYPLTVPLLLSGAPVHRLADLFSLFHFWLAGFTVFLLLRDLKADALSSLFGGVAWMLSARVVQSAIWPSAVAVSALLPLLLMGILRIGRGQRRSGVVSVAVCGGLILLASRPQLLLGAAPILAVVAASAVLHASRRKQALGDLMVAALLAGALGAASVLPCAALYSGTSRRGGLTRIEREVPVGSGLDVAQFFLPVDGGARWPEAAAYPGFLAGLFFLIGLALVIRRGAAFPRRPFVAVASGGFVGLLFAFGEGGPYGLFANLPLIRAFRIPERYLTSWSLAIALGSALILSRVILRFRRRRPFALSCLLLLGADLAIHARRCAPTALSSIYSVEPEAVSTLRACLSKDEVGFPHRFWSLPEIPYLLFYRDEEQVAVVRRFEPLYLGLGMRYGLDSIRGLGLTLARTEKMFQVPTRRAAELAGVGCIALSERSSMEPSRALPPTPRIREFSPLSRAVLVPAAIVVPSEQALAGALDPAFDPRRTAILEEGEPLSLEREGQGKSGTVQLISRTPSCIDLMTRSSGEGVLVVFNSFEHGWRASVDGDPVSILRADWAFLGIRLAPGAHRVRLTYHPPGLKEGVGLGLVGALGCALAALRLKRVAD